MPATEVPTMSPAGARAAKKLEALRQIQSQAEHRVKIGAQLLKAAEAHTQHTRSYLEEVRAEQNEMREKLEKDVAAALHQYDQWVGTIDENLTRRIEKMEARLDAIELHWQEVEERVLKLVRRSEVLMDKSRAIIEVVAELDEGSLDDGAGAQAATETAGEKPVAKPQAAKRAAPAKHSAPKENLYTRLIKDLNNE